VKENIENLFLNTSVFNELTTYSQYNAKTALNL